MSTGVVGIWRLAFDEICRIPRISDICVLFFLLVCMQGLFPMAPTPKALEGAKIPIVRVDSFVFDRSRLSRTEIEKDQALRQKQLGSGGVL